MATVLNRAHDPEQRILLHGVKWETYERLLEDLGDRSAPRMAFDRGTLEIMSPTAEHEQYNRTLALLVEIAAEEMAVDIRRLGSTTFRRKDLLEGFEPDSCFYIQSADAIAGKTGVDLAQDPPPDLVIEIDITSPSLDRFPIFAQVGVPEIWRFDGTQVQIFRLEGKTYAAAGHSRSFPCFSAQGLTDLLKASIDLTSTAWLRRVRQWIRAEIDGHA